MAIKPRLKNFFVVLILAVASVWFAQPLFLFRPYGEGGDFSEQGFWQTHNLMFVSHEHIYPVVRVIEYAAGLSDGYLFPRLSANLAGGYGYPFFYFYAPLSYTVAALGMLFSLTAYTALKIQAVMAVFFSMIGLYAFARHLRQSTGAALLAALLYGFAPYHISNLYVRANYAELTAMAILPFMFLAYHKLLKEPRLKWLAAGALAHAALILSHNVTALFATGAVLCYCLLGGFLLKSSRRVYLFSATAFLFAFALSAFFWVPALTDIRECGGDSGMEGTYDRSAGHVVYLKQLFTGQWGFGDSVSGREDGMAFFLGAPFIILSLLTLYYILKNRGGVDKSVYLMGIFAVGCVLSATTLFTWLWSLPGFKLIQFPWRMFSMGTMFLALFCGYGLSYLFNEKVFANRFWKSAFLFCTGIGIAFWAYPMLSVSGYYKNPAEMYSASMNRQNYMLTNIGEFMPSTAWGSPHVESVNARRLLIDGEESARIMPQNFLDFRYRGNLPENAVITYPAFYFKPWRASVNGQAIILKAAADGLIELPPLSGPVDLRIWFGYSKAGIIGAGISGTALVGMIITFLYFPMRRKWLTARSSAQ